MSHVLRWLPEAVWDLARLREFIRVHNSKAAERAAKRLLEFVKKLQVHPYIGRPVVDIAQPEFRDLFIPFGQAGYRLRYKITGDEIIIIRIWHTRENR
jgi:plasmid stabilization system protein ParE